METRRRASWPLAVLCVLGVLLTWCGLGPARAQMGHTHQWVKGGDPDALIVITHQDGQPVTPQYPATRCEILKITWVGGGVYDEDACDAPGHDPQTCQVDFHCQALYYRDFRDGDPDVAGTFGVMQDGVFVPAEDTYPDGIPGRKYGVPGASHYKVGRTHPASPLYIELRLDDSGTVNDGPDQMPAFDDAKIWKKFPEMAVEGTGCTAVRTARGCARNERGFCLAGTKQPGNSSVTPLDGNVSFTVPITSWGYRGTTLDFSLTYNSQSVVDPELQANQVRDPAALSDSNPGNHYNPKWTHTYAQWIEVLADGNAVWNQGDGTQHSFIPETGPNGEMLWRGRDGNHTLTSSGLSTSPQFEYEGEPLTVAVPYSEFVLKDGEGTEYRFDQVRWNISPSPQNAVGYAIPYFLLKKITDRWGRVVNITWGPDGVTTVADGAGRGLTFAYSNGLIGSVTDTFGRVHTFTRTNIATPSGGVQPKLTGIVVQGPGSPHRVQHQWAFGYTEAAGYGGTYTGDLVVTKVEPDGNVVHYEHEPVNPARTSGEDWDGRLARSWYVDDLETPPALRQIVRTGTTLTYNGGSSYTYQYDGHHLESVTHDNTGAAVYYTWDAKHNLASVRTNREWNPLVSLEYTYGGASGRQILGVTATDILGHQATSTFNALNLPTEVRAIGDGMLPDQVTRFIYDGGGPLTVGNLTRVISAWGSPLAEATDFTYGNPNFPGLPTAVQDALGATASVTYLYPDGSPRYTTGPENLVAPAGDPDRAPSVTSTQQNAEELPSVLQDALGHGVEVTYCAEAPGSARMVVTVRSLSDASTTRMTLDANGQVVEAVDQNGVTSRVDYNRAGQPVRVRRAVGTPNERSTHYYYNEQGDLQALDPPAGPTSRVTFEYSRYDVWYPGFPPQKAQPEVYTGQVTRIHYPDGTSEYFGYNEADEPAWHVGQDGRTVTLDRDALHRVYRVNYPDTPGFAGFSVESSFDHFGRVYQVQDPTGISTYTYDDRNRTVTVTPAAGQGASFQYLEDPVLKRRSTRMTVTGAGAWEYRGDGKGRTAQVLNPFGQLTSWKYDPAGRLLRESRSNGTWTDYSYNTRNWLTQMEHRLADGSLLDRFQYLYTDGNGVYDPTGHLRREVDAGGRTHAFAYNELYELMGEAHPDFGTRLFTYDANGNRRSQSVPGTFTEWYGYDAQNKLLWSNQAADAVPTPGQTQPFRTFSYDPNGQPLTSTVRDAAGLTERAYGWDGMRKLRSLTATGALAETFAAEYDGGGMRARSTRNGVTTTYSFGLLEEISGGGSTVYTPGVSQRQNGVDRFFHSDWIGSTRYLTDGTGLSAPTAYRFDAYGNQSASAGPDATTRKYAGSHGYESDGPAGMQLLGHRFYDPALGRFLNPDPIGFAGGLNLYAYCGGDPVGLVDPSGLDPFDANELSDEEITRGGLLTRRLLAAGFHGRDMTYANSLHQQLGMSAFRSGNRPLAMDAFNIHQTVGQVGAGGPVLGAVSCTRAIGSPLAATPKKSFWDSFTDWVVRFARRGGPRRNSHLSQGPSHVYSLHGPSKVSLKVGFSGDEAINDVSQRAQAQVDKLNRTVGPGHSYRVRRHFPDASSGLLYEKRLRDRYESRYGRRLPLNHEKRRRIPYR